MILNLMYERKNQELQDKMARLEKTSAMLYQAIGGIVRSPDE